MVRWERHPEGSAPRGLSSRKGQGGGHGRTRGAGRGCVSPYTSHRAGEGPEERSWGAQACGGQEEPSEEAMQQTASIFARGAGFPGRPRGALGGAEWALRAGPPSVLGPLPHRPEADPGHRPGGLRALPHVHGGRPAAAARAEVVPLRQRRGHLRHVWDRDVHRRAGGTAAARGGLGGGRRAAQPGLPHRPLAPRQAAVLGGRGR